MIVIADSSPLIVLVKIGHIDILSVLFQQIVVPPAVLKELQLPGWPDDVRAFSLKLPAWIIVQQPTRLLTIEKLHIGETEALSLAMELHADFLLVDERNAYRAAVARKVNAIGTVRVLEIAAQRKLLDLKDAFDRLRKTNFWISEKLLDDRLKMFQKNMMRDDA